MDESERRDRRLIFGEEAEAYDTYRPGYPEALFDDVLDLARLEPGDAVLEVGAGTGKATREWASRGLRVTALEPDPRMAEVARRTTPDGTDVEVVGSTFEDWDAGGQRFSLVAAAQSWHWVDPEVGFTTAADLLDHAGWLALFWSGPVDRGGDLAAPIDAVYARLVPTMRSQFAGSGGSKTEQGWPDKLREHGFGAVSSRRYRFPVTYTTDAYVGLLTTHSDHRMLDEDLRADLLAEVAGVIDEAGSEIHVTYETRLHAARPTP